jgi:hypothetical protein
MAEYWKSTVSLNQEKKGRSSPLDQLANCSCPVQPKYWCKHCKTYVRDTPFERDQHESTGKHQAALKRFLRDIHRGKEQEEKEAQKAKSEVERLRGLVSGSGPGSKQEQRQQPPWKDNNTTSTASTASQSVAAEERKKQLAQLVDMGVAIPDEFRPDMALAGDWKSVAEEQSSGNQPTTGQRTPDAVAVGVRGVRKRKIRDRGEEQEREEAGDAARAGQRKAWGSAIRHHPGDGDEELDALLEMTSELKGRKSERQLSFKSEVKMEDPVFKREEEGLVPVKAEQTGGDSEAPSNGDAPVKPESDGPGDVKLPEDVAEPSLHSIPEATADTPTGEATVVFKKRKSKQMKR